MSNPENPQPEVSWTAKGPALIAAIALLLGALVASGRRAFATSLVLAVLGFGFLAYSLTIKDWCALKGTTYGQTPWGQGFGGGLGDCLKAKGWWQF